MTRLPTTTVVLYLISFTRTTKGFKHAVDNNLTTHLDAANLTRIKQDSQCGASAPLVDKTANEPLGETQKITSFGRVADEIANELLGGSLKIISYRCVAAEIANELLGGSSKISLLGWSLDEIADKRLDGSAITTLSI